MLGDLVLFPRVKTGVSGLDSLLLGGLPSGSLVLVTGPPGSGKSMFTKQFLYHGALEDADVTVLSTAESPESIKESMANLGWDNPYIERIRVMDCYSWKQEIKPTVDLRNLTEVSIELTKYINALGPTGNPRLVIDSLTDFLLNNEADGTLRFLGQIKVKLQTRRVTTLVLLEEGIHPNNVAVAVEYLADGTIRTKFDESGRYLMVSRMLATPTRPIWSEFTIEKGIEVKVRDFFGGGGK